MNNTMNDYYNQQHGQQPRAGNATPQGGSVSPQVNQATTSFQNPSSASGGYQQPAQNNQAPAQNYTPTAFGFSQDDAQKTSGGNHINESGAYKGVFTHAQMGRSDSGWEYLDLDFQCVDGRESNFMRLFIFGPDKKKEKIEPKRGYYVVQAILACIGQQAFQPQLTNNYRKYESGKSEPILMQGYTVPHLVGPPIGLVMEAVRKSDEKFPNMEIKMPFHHQSNQTSQELINSKEPQSVLNLVKTLEPVRIIESKLPSHAGGYDSAGSTGHYGNGGNDFTDDIPF